MDKGFYKEKSSSGEKYSLLYICTEIRSILNNNFLYWMA